MSVKTLALAQIGVANRLKQSVQHLVVSDEQAERSRGLVRWSAFVLQALKSVCRTGRPVMAS